MLSGCRETQEGCCRKEALVLGCARQLSYPQAHFLALQEFDLATVLSSQL